MITLNLCADLYIVKQVRAAVLIKYSEFHIVDISHSEIKAANQIPNNSVLIIDLGLTYENRDNRIIEFMQKHSELFKKQTHVFLQIANVSPYQFKTKEEVLALSEYFHAIFHFNQNLKYTKIK